MQVPVLGSSRLSENIRSWYVKYIIISAFFRPFWCNKTAIINWKYILLIVFSVVCVWRVLITSITVCEYGMVDQIKRITYRI